MTQRKLLSLAVAAALGSFADRTGAGAGQAPPRRRHERKKRPRRWRSWWSPRRSARKRCRTCRSRHRAARATAAGHRRARHQGPAGAGARPDRDQHAERGADHRAHPRHRHGRRQRRPGILGRRRHRRRLPAAQRRRLRRPGRDRAHRSAQGPAGHGVRQEHLGRRDQRHHPPPHYETAVEGELTVGNYNALGVVRRVQHRIGESAALRVYAAKRERDGFIDVHTGAGPRTETEDGDQNFHTLRGQLLFEPTDNLDINLSADFTSREENCCVGVTIVRGGTAAIIDALSPDEGVAPVADPFARVAWSNRSTEQDIKDKGIAAEVNWITPWFGGATLTSITARRDWEIDQRPRLRLHQRRPAVSQCGRGRVVHRVRDLQPGIPPDRLDRHASTGWSVRSIRTKTSSATRPTASARPTSRTCPVGAAGVAGQPGAWARSPRPRRCSCRRSAAARSAPVSPGFGADDIYQQNAKSAGVVHQQHLACHRRARPDAGPALHARGQGARFDLQQSQWQHRAARFDARPTGSAKRRSGAWPALPAARRAAGAAASCRQQWSPTIVGFMCLPWANPLHNGRATHQEREEKEWSGTIKAAYRWNDHLMTYVSAARGYKAGGFNLDRVQSNTGLSSGGAGIVPVNDTSFPGEFVDSYELGAKTTWVDGNLLLNATLFHQTYEDFQLNSFLGTSFVVRSIPEVVSQGIDTECSGSAARGPDAAGRPDLCRHQLWRRASGRRLHRPGGLRRPARCTSCRATRSSFAPYWSGTASVTYEWDFGGNLRRPLQPRRQVHVRIQHRLGPGRGEGAGRLYRGERALRLRRHGTTAGWSSCGA